jgi:ribosomal protein S18 acetylase RimI-like enzyme
VRAGVERVDDLQPLWESLHDHHVAVAPHLAALGPVRERAGSWAVRRALYEGWLGEPGAFVLLAEERGRPVGYALVTLHGTEESWVLGERIASLQTLAVLPDQRGRGIGRALMDRVYAELRAAGVRELDVAVIWTNADARRFYEREGLLPFTVSYLGRVPD